MRTAINARVVRGGNSNTGMSNFDVSLEIAPTMIHIVTMPLAFYP